MSEVEWLDCEDAKKLNECLRTQFNAHRRKIGRRRYRLFGCAIARRWWDSLTDPRSRAAVEFAERFADEQATSAERELLYDDALGAYEDLGSWAGLHLASRRERLPERRAANAAWAVLDQSPGYCVYAHWAMLCSLGQGDDEAGKEWRAELRQLCRLFREIFGNPFRPVAFDPAWRTSTAVALATQMYDSRNFGAMPILADALQDAGCENADILDHCRGPGPHVRGCWVVDLVLGKQ